MLHATKDKPSAPAAAPEAPITTREQAEGVAFLVAAETVNLNTQISAKNAELLKVTAFDAEITRLNATIETHRVRLEAWASANRKQLFTDGKTLELQHAVLFFKTGNRGLGLLNKKWTWDRVLTRLLGPGWTEAILKLLSGNRQYVKLSPELNKQKVLADAKGPAPVLSPAELRRMGLKITQEERFYVEPKLEAVKP